VPQPVFTINVATRPLGQLFGGKQGQSVECPVCSRPAVLFKSGRTAGVFWTEYAHQLSFDLDSHNEPVMHASEICRRQDDPSAKGRKVAKGRK
jgi:hypothetical protein